MNQDLFIFKDLSSEQIQFYEENGYLKLGNTLSELGVQKAMEECMIEWEKEKGEFDPSNSWLKNSLLVDIHKRSKLVRDFYFKGPIVGVMNTLIGPNIKGVTSQLTFKMRGNTKPFGWHQDNGYGELNPYNSITTLTALEDTDEENGCLRIIPKSHKVGQIDVSDIINNKTKKEKVSIDLDVDESMAIPMPLKAGETLIFHCNTLHQSQGNFSKDRDRRILFLRYADADAVEVYNNNKPRLGRLLTGKTKFIEVEDYEKEL